MTLAEDLPRQRRPALTPAGPGTLEFSASLHATALPDGFFPRLGQRFLQAYHETFLSSPHGLAFTAWRDGRPVGFLVGTAANAAHYRWVVRNRGVRLAARGALALLVRPRVALRFLRTRTRRYCRGLLRLAGRPRLPGIGRRRGREGLAADVTQPGPQRVAVLTHVAVAEDGRGDGVGTALVDAFVGAAAQAGAQQAQLVTAADSHATHAFYRRGGWRKREDRTDHDGRPVSRFVRELT